MNKWLQMYSRYGLQQMIEENKEQIKKLKSDYIAVEQGLLYNPLCKNENMKEILKMISEEENLIKEWQESLIIMGVACKECWEIEI